jgi:hypothetical protein
MSETYPNGIDINTMILKTVSEVKEKEYSAIRKKLEDKKHSLQFLPAQMEAFSKSKNFEYKGQKLKVAYVIDITHNLILKYYFKKDNSFSLMSTILKEKYGYLYNYYIDWLVETGIIYMVRNYKAGQNARVYKISESVLKGVIKRYVNKDNILLKKYKNKVSQVEDGGLRDGLIDSDIKAMLVDDLFHAEIQFDRAIFYLDSLAHNDTDIYNRNRYSVECVNDKHIFYHFDGYGRMHTNFTILKSFIRKNCLMLDGEETHEIDIKNSQPLFLNKIIEDSGTKWVAKEEIALFRHLTIEGIYYQYVMDHIGTKDKPKVKEMTYKVLFGKNMASSKADKVFKELFPTIHNFIRLYKKEKGDYRILAYELQKAESSLIFNKIIKQIKKSVPNMKIVTVHDSIIVPRSQRDAAEAIFKTKLFEEFGIFHDMAFNI